MSRLAIQKDTLRDLAIRSKNKCAFPGCDHAILNPQNNYIAELCHIEAVEPGGSRYNPGQSEEDCRAFPNLLFLCHSHHKETDDESRFSVTDLQNMKKDHEELPEVVFNHELLLKKIEIVQEDQAKLLKLVLSKNSQTSMATSFPIVGPLVKDAWTPKDGRFYEFKDKTGSGFKFSSRNGWLHIEQTLSDGAIAYYEINEQGQVRNSRFPYPINEYHVEIPESLVLEKKPVPSSLGTRAVLTVLKWSIGTVIEHFQGNTFIGADCHARTTIDHAKRIIRVMEPKK